MTPARPRPTTPTCSAADASRGRFVLGLGASSNVIVERWNGVPFERPLTKMRETLAFLRPVLAGERGPGGFKLENPPAAPVPIVLAALRGGMLKLAAAEADGAFTNFLPLSGLPQVVAGVREGEAIAGREPGSVDLSCRFFCVPGSQEEGLATARTGGWRRWCDTELALEGEGAREAADRRGRIGRRERQPTRTQQVGAPD